MEERKIYHLIGPDGQPYDSYEKGMLGGYRHSKSKSDKNLYGRLDCPTALRALAKGDAYKEHRVFFKDEETAIAAGYRPCHDCMLDKYLAWKARHSDGK